MISQAEDGEKTRTEIPVSKNEHVKQKDIEPVNEPIRNKKYNTATEINLEQNMVHSINKKSRANHRISVDTKTDNLKTTISDINEKDRTNSEAVNTSLHIGLDLGTVETRSYDFGVVPPGYNNFDLATRPWFLATTLVGGVGGVLLVVVVMMVAVMCRRKAQGKENKNNQQL